MCLSRRPSIGRGTPPPLEFNADRTITWPRGYGPGTKKGKASGPVWVRKRKKRVGLPVAIQYAAGGGGHGAIPMNEPPAFGHGHTPHYPPFHGGGGIPPIHSPPIFGHGDHHASGPLHSGGGGTQHAQYHGGMGGTTPQWGNSQNLINPWEAQTTDMRSANSRRTSKRSPTGRSVATFSNITHITGSGNAPAAGMTVAPNANMHGQVHPSELQHLQQHGQTHAGQRIRNQEGSTAYAPSQRGRGSSNSNRGRGGSLSSRGTMQKSSRSQSTQPYWEARAQDLTATTRRASTVAPTQQSRESRTVGLRTGRGNASHHG